VWPEKADAGHAIANVDVIANLLLRPRTHFALVWGTHWDKDDFAGNVLGMETNALNAIGRAHSLFASNLGTAMVFTKSSNMKVSTYASIDGEAARLTTFLINKDTVAHTCQLKIKDFNDQPMTEHYLFAGSGHDDLKASIIQLSPCKPTHDGYRLILPPVSLTVLSWKK
jgi:hypothetical protein